MGVLELPFSILTVRSLAVSGLKNNHRQPSDHIEANQMTDIKSQ